MKRFVIVSLVSVVAAPAMPVAAGQAAAAQGPVILIGGALADDNDEIYGEIIRLAGGPHARIGVITAASIPPSVEAQAGAGSPEGNNSASNGRFYAGLLKKHGAGDAQWIPIDLTHHGAADSRPVVDQVNSMTGFFFGGGDQSRLITTLMHGAAHTDTRALTAIRAKLAHGAMIAGTSAGAQIQAGPDMVTGGTSYRALRDGPQPGRHTDETTLGYLPAGGFGLFTDGLLDTHFSTHGRLGRAVRLATDTGHTRIFGLDPDTALEATPGTLRVIGRHGISIIDLRHATPATHHHWSITGVHWTYLTAGTTYHPRTWTYRLPPHAHPLTPHNRTTRPPVPDIFDSPAGPMNGFTLTNTALDLAAAGQSRTCQGTTLETAPQFVVTLRKGPGFTAYQVGGAISFADLTVSIYAV